MPGASAEWIIMEKLIAANFRGISVYHFGHPQYGASRD
jgi:hypothetical protein